MQFTTIASYVTKETEVGIMIVHLQRFGVDMEMVNQFIHISSESIKVGNTTEKLNGSKEWLFGVTDSTFHYG
jgi:hypothetical protein